MTAITLLSIYPKEKKIYIHSKFYTLMFISIPFTIVPNWEQSKCPSKDKELNSSIFISWNITQE